MPVSLLELVRKADRLPSLPAVAAEVLRLTQASDVDVTHLVSVIQKEPALAVSILKTVNSSLFGLTRKVTSLRQATVILGLRTVKVLALSFSLVDVLNEQAKFNYQAYWRRSLLTAVAARLLAQSTGHALTEEAFVCGLLSEVGMVAAFRVAPERYQPVLEAWTDSVRPLTEIETEMLGATHPQMGRELLRHWNLPESLCDSVGAHHGEGLNEMPEETQSLARFVYCAARIAGMFTRETLASEFDAIKDECRALTGITEDALELVLTDLDNHVRELAATLSLRVGTPVKYAQLLAEAAEQLAQLSVQAEPERAAEAEREELVRKETALRMRRTKALENQIAALEADPPGASQPQAPPASSPITASADVGVYCQPLPQPGGDFYSVLKLKHGSMGVLIGGVTGCGAESGILAGQAHKVLAERLLELEEPVLALCGANQALAAELGRNSVVTACVAVCSPSARTLHLASADHAPPLFLTAAQHPRLSVLNAPGQSLGMAQGSHYSLTVKGLSLQTAPGDMLLLYSDGVFDTEDARGRKFGEHSLAGVFRAAAHSSAQQAVEALARELSLFRGAAPQRRGLTALCMKFAR